MSQRPECAPDQDRSALAHGNGEPIARTRGDGPATNRLCDVAQHHVEGLPLSRSLAWLGDLCGQFVRGGVYLLGGAPGGFKSGLALQVSLDLNRQGIRTLAVMTEEPSSRLRDRALHMTSQWPKTHVQRAFSNLYADCDLNDIELLPHYLARHVLSAGGRYHGVQMIVLDSIQGHGLAAAATRKYERLYESARLCKAAGITMLLVSHVTKRGELAGPRAMEHNCDAVLLLRRSMNYRLLFCPKNRFGPATFKPLALELDPISVTLRPSPHAQSMTSIARTFLGGIGAAEIQAAVALSGFGSRGKVTAPGLPRREIEQLIACLGGVPGIELNELDFTLHCRVPGSRPFHPVLGLPLCMALISSYIQRPIPQHQLQIGEIDLLRSVRDLPDQLIADLSNGIADGSLAAPLRLIVPPSTAAQLPRGGSVEVVACKRLEDALFSTWPELH